LSLGLGNVIYLKYKFFIPWTLFCTH